MTGPTKLLTRAESNPKTAKGAGLGYMGCIMHLAPAGLVGAGRSTCPWATPGCASMCLNTAGRGASRGDLGRENLERSPIHRARLARTDSFFESRGAFLRQLSHELTLLERRARVAKLWPCARPNGTSDLPWETLYAGMPAFPFKHEVPGAPYQSIFSRHPAIQFYDYTKSYKKARAFGLGELPSNYHITFSRDEHTSAESIHALVALGVNVAVVFRHDLPTDWLGIQVINGDKHDYRFLDPKGVIVGLVAKGRARHDSSGFVVDA